MLGVHQLGFLRRNIEEGGVELIVPGHETAVFHIAVRPLFRIAPDGSPIPAAGGDFLDTVATLAQVLAEGLEIGTHREFPGHRDDRHGDRYGNLRRSRRVGRPGIDRRLGRNRPYPVTLQPGIDVRRALRRHGRRFKTRFVRPDARNGCGGPGRHGRHGRDGRRLAIVGGNRLAVAAAQDGAQFVEVPGFEEGGGRNRDAEETRNPGHQFGDGDRIHAVIGQVLLRIEALGRNAQGSNGQALDILFETPVGRRRRGSGRLDGSHRDGRTPGLDLGPQFLLDQLAHTVAQVLPCFFVSVHVPSFLSHPAFRPAAYCSSMSRYLRI